ncbi:hypothetical protein CYMTET_10791 [Cymbomonas tetramitiformis]|uniref:P-type ATPase A domain-containing protein n=1 Tax=Cymbomonas tetramitiformis TaxID=36881 RepID=A0AAE0LDT5_9CHLO|nr:hypothetical protein CYMTET_10791 [Cymbomonas tetramitiformis]
MPTTVEAHRVRQATSLGAVGCVGESRRRPWASVVGKAALKELGEDREAWDLAGVEEDQRNQRIVSDITDAMCPVTVLRGSQWQVIDSYYLVPGDKVELRPGMTVVCDMAVTEGLCVCDESSLSGEGMPVHKTALPDDWTQQYTPQGPGARYTLFAGSQVMHAHGSTPNKAAHAVVIATGISTNKGAMISGILYQHLMVFKYDEELPVALILLGVYAAICFALALHFQHSTWHEMPAITAWAYGMFTISQVLSPLLPVALQVAQLSSAEDLNRKGIRCLSPRRIPISGKIRVFCFDKTGTLTKPELELLGILPVVHPPGLAEYATEAAPTQGPDDLLFGADEAYFAVDELLVPQAAGSPLAICGLACCHALSSFEGRLMGSQVEENMFAATGWEPRLAAEGAQLEFVSPSGKEVLQVVRRFEFDYVSQTMSVVVKDTTGRLQVFCKGSFEAISRICRPDSVPLNYDVQARNLAADGCYVLAVAHLHLGEMEEDQVHEMCREDVEEHLVLLCLVGFQSQLQEDCISTMQRLKVGDIRPVMITGDNAQCGHCVAQACGMVTEGARMWLGECMEDGEVIWAQMDWGACEDSEEPPMTTEKASSAHSSAPAPSRP